MGAYDRPKDGEATREQLAAWDKGYRASEDGNAPSLGGLYRGEELYYIAGFNRSRVERGELLVRLSPLRSGGHDLVEEEMPKDIPTDYVPPAGEVRTTSSTGGMKGVKPERFSLLPVEALNSVARLYAFGAIKYAAHNWRKGYEWTKSYDSLMRHATQSLNGEDYDEETGEPHLAGVVFHAFTLMCYLFDYERYGKFDDRFKHEDLEDGMKLHVSEETIGEEAGWTQQVVENALKPADIYRRTLRTMGLDKADVLMQEYQGKVFTPIEEMIDFLAGMYENWSIQTSRELRRVAGDLRNDKNRNVQSFADFRERFSIETVTDTHKMAFVDHDTEIEPIQPAFNVRSMMVTIPTVVGAVYYYNDRHVVGSFQIRSNSEIKAVALPGYRFASGMETEWTYLA